MKKILEYKILTNPNEETLNRLARDGWSIRTITDNLTVYLWREVKVR